MRNRNVTLGASLWLVGLVSVMSAQPVVFNGLTHTPMGRATLRTDGSHLQVDNVGDSGNDGVRINISTDAGGNAIEFVWAAELPDGSPTGSKFITKYYGSHPDRGTILIGSSTMMMVAGGGQMTPDYGASTYTLQLQREGTVVYEQRNMIGPACVAASASKGKVCWFGTGICSYHFGVTTASELHAVTVTGGPTVTADQIVITPDPATFVGVTFVTSCEATGAGIASFRVGEETIVSSPATVDYRSAANGGAMLSVSPNPARGTVTAGISLPSSERVRLQLADINGNIVASTVAGPFSAGTQRIDVPLVDASGNRLASGVYVLRLQAGPYTATSKLVVAQ